MQKHHGHDLKRPIPPVPLPRTPYNNAMRLLGPTASASSTGPGSTVRMWLDSFAFAELYTAGE